MNYAQNAVRRRMDKANEIVCLVFVVYLAIATFAPRGMFTKKG